MKTSCIPHLLNLVASRHSLARFLALTWMGMKTWPVSGLTVLNKYEETQKKQYHGVGQSWIPDEVVVEHEDDEQWKSKLTVEQYYITQKRGTERPFSGEYNNFHGKGLFHCVCCGAPLFSSEHKYESDSGWPSFWSAYVDHKVSHCIADEMKSTCPYEQGDINVRQVIDHSHGMVRTEVVCKKCGAHLGHVFSDGPQPTGQRFCINSLSLKFRPNKDKI